MKKPLFFKQKKPLTVWLLGSFLLLLTLYFIVSEEAPVSQLLVMSLLSIALLGYSISYEISPDFKNKIHFKMLGISVIRTNAEILFPEFIGLFSVRFKQGAEWGSVAAMGKERIGHTWVIRLFKGNKHFTLYRNNSLARAKKKATELSTLLDIELRVKE